MQKKYCTFQILYYICIVKLLKNCFDISLVTLAIIISWVEFGTLQGVGAGTVVAAVLVGRFVHLYESRLSFFDRWKVEA